MATKTFCDKCQVEITETEYTTGKTGVGFAYHSKDKTVSIDWDLCDDCYDEVNKFIHQKGVRVV